MNTGAPLYGLVLAGGQSSRMGKDKAALIYEGKPQHETVADLLNALCERVYLSLNPNQEIVSQYNTLVDVYDSIGPMGGLLTAFETHSDVAWLVVACDMPLLDKETLTALIEKRDPTQWATAYTDAAEKYYQPLCCIYEPKAKQSLLSAAKDKDYSLHRLLSKHPTRSVKLSNSSQALDNANTPQDYATFKRLKKS